MQISSTTNLEVTEILAKTLETERLSTNDAKTLLELDGDQCFPLFWTADKIRQCQVGDVVTFVINRNINFTNICMNKCKFCSFSVRKSSEKSYFLTKEDIQKKIREVQPYDISEVCIQGGIHPDMTLDNYIEIIRAVKEVDERIHVHSFSPEEIKYASEQSGKSITSVLSTLKEAGLDSIPGTAAEILVDKVRKRICPQKLTTKEWIEVIKTAHKLGIPSTATILFGHVETVSDRVEHLQILLDIQKETGGFTEFVPLPFIAVQTPLQRRIPQPMSPSGMEILKLYAVSRLMLGWTINNLQASWVKLGPQLAQVALFAGCNDLGGTLFEENITRSAGGIYGQKLSPKRLEFLIKSLKRSAAVRSTLYTPLRHL